MSLAVAAAGGAARAATPIMPVSEVKAGMKAKGLTVMSGTEPEEFGVEIIGVLRKANAGGDMILGRMIGAGVEHTGAASGMSGSPIYIDGKLIGALAFSWSFSKDPICGITPIEDMLTTMTAAPGAARANGGGDLSERRFRNVLSAIASGGAELAAKQPAPLSPAGVSFDVPGVGAGELSPIATPLMVSGFTDRARAALKDFFVEQTGVTAVAGGSSGGDSADGDAETALKPGGVISIPLMTGDFEAYMFGTVTWRDGDDVLAFGHPMANAGALELPMAGGRVVHVMANQMGSFKMADMSHKIVGGIIMDRQFAIRGVMGRTVSMIPVSLKVSGAGVSKTYRVQVARYEKLPYRLIVSAMMNGIGLTTGDMMEATAKVRFSLKFKGLDEPVVLNDMYYADQAGYLDISEHLGAIVDNPFREMDLESCDAEVSLDLNRRTATIGAVTVGGGGRVKPGGTFSAYIELKDFGGGARLQPVKITLPKDAPAGMYKIVALGGSGLYLRDTPPDNFSQYMDDVKGRAPLNSLIAVIIYPEKAAALRGETLMNSPASMRDLMAYGSFSGVTPVDKTDKILIPMDSVISGQSMALFTVEKP